MSAATTTPTARVKFWAWAAKILDKMPVQSAARQDMAVEMEKHTKPT